MKSLIRLILISFLLPALTAGLYAQDFAREKWRALWISVPDEDPHDYGVYHFKKKVDLATVPDQFKVFISADNRYKLFVNDVWVAHGPARSDIYHWNYDVIDLAPYLRPGHNDVVATVWNFGEHRPEAQISFRTAFIMQGASTQAEVLNTNRTWQCVRDMRYSPLTPDLIYTYYVAGPAENVDFGREPKPSAWKDSQELWHGLPKGVFEWTNGWMLVPRKIPPMELRAERLASVRSVRGVSLPEGFLSGEKSVTIPPDTTAMILFDQGFLTNAYPTMQFSGGSGAHVRLSYAEALYENEKGDDWKSQKQKGDRNDIAGKRFVGVSDQIIADGQRHVYTPLWWRTYRYLQLEVKTKQEPLLIHELFGLATGYPFELNANFSSSEPWLEKIFETGWRTAKLCASETYMDCPYYEQLQYIGDARIQALVSLFNSGDDRLMRRAIEQIDNSRMAEGITLSRYPSANPQQIPTFSLWWIAMVHDFWQYRSDEKFVQTKLSGIRQVLAFFQHFQANDGSLYHPPYWEFTDWAENNGWERGVAPVGKDGHSSILDLQLCLGYQHAAELEAALGSKENAQQYQYEAKILRETILKKYWDNPKRLISDTSDKRYFSQHANTLAILAGVLDSVIAQDVARQVLTNRELTQATIYFKYYVNQAVHRAGLGDLYVTSLEDWKRQLEHGLTTWAEISNDNLARSDCHAWGSSPNIELFRIILGIESGSPGFNTVVVKPHLGPLTSAEGKMPHPKGTISVKYRSKKKKWSAVIELPPEIPGTFIWKGRTFPLRPGKNLFENL